MFDNAIVITESEPFEIDTGEDSISQAMNPSHNIEWDFWEARRESLAIEQLSAADIADAAAVVVGGQWFGRILFQPWKSPEDRFSPTEFPPLDWIKAQGKFAIIVTYHH